MHSHESQPAWKNAFTREPTCMKNAFTWANLHEKTRSHESQPAWKNAFSWEPTCMKKCSHMRANLHEKMHSHESQPAWKNAFTWEPTCMKKHIHMWAKLHEKMRSHEMKTMSLEIYRRWKLNVTIKEMTMHPNIVLTNEGSMVQTCRNTNVHVVNTDICWDPHECLWIAWESRPINVHSIS